MKKKRRNSFAENLVFGIAALLAVVLAYYGARRWTSRPAPRPMEVSTTVVLPPVPQAKLSLGRTESAIEELPPLRIARTGSPHRKKTAAPPPPKK